MKRLQTLFTKARKALRELRRFGFIHKMPRLAVIQAEGAAPFYEFMRTRGEFQARRGEGRMEPDG